jgi:hypothetical protein
VEEETQRRAKEREREPRSKRKWLVVQIEHVLACGHFDAVEAEVRSEEQLGHTMLERRGRPSSSRSEGSGNLRVASNGSGFRVVLAPVLVP